MDCPGCRSSSMQVEYYPAHYGRTVEIDVCHDCNGFWFDNRESLQLTPGSTLQLFKSMQDGHLTAGNQLVDDKRCPRCQIALRPSHDVARGTRFQAFECVQHGRYITFFQWLREKGLVRAPTPQELQELKQHLVQVNCSNCGAPVALSHQAVCSHCQTPVSILAPDAVARAVAELAKQEQDRVTVKPGLAIEAMLMGVHHREREKETRDVDLITEGLEALLAFAFSAIR